MNLLIFLVNNVVYLGSVEKFLSPSQSISCEGFLSSEELLNSVRSLNIPGRHPDLMGCRWNFTYFFVRLWVPFCPVLLIDVLLTANCVPQ